jgi:DNA-binding NarL/FixJ family response regulator
MKILLVDDHPIVRAGLRRLLGIERDMEIREATTSREALTSFREDRPDLVMLDLNLPDVGGLELLKRLMTEDHTARILIFSMHAEPIYVVRALQAGAIGYISKGAPPDELIEAIRRVASGVRYIERELAQELAFRNALSANPSPVEQLSSRDLEILRLLAEGRSMTEIADAIGIGYKTVANTCSQMKTKLGVTRTADLVRIAIEIGTS